MVLLAVVDANYRFVYVNVGSQGRLSEGGFFAHSKLHRAMDEGLLNVPPPEAALVKWIDKMSIAIKYCNLYLFEYPNNVGYIQIHSLSQFHQVKAI